MRDEVRRGLLDLVKGFVEVAKPELVKRDLPTAVLVVDEQQNVTRESLEALQKRGDIVLVPSDEVRLDARTMAREKIERRLLGGSNLNIWGQKPN